MRQSPIAGFVTQIATKYEIPGVAVAIWTKGKAYLACHGVTDLDQPEPIEPETPFLVASVTKTFTATAMMRLVADQQRRTGCSSAALLARICGCRPRRLGTDHSAQPAQPHRRTGLGIPRPARRQRQCARPLRGGPSRPATHRSPWARACLTARPDTTSQVASSRSSPARPTSRRWQPWCLSRWACGTARSLPERRSPSRCRWATTCRQMAPLAVAQAWKGTRANNPGGGLAASASDLLAWARFHLSDGGFMLPENDLHLMRQPTANVVGSSLGDAVGIGWFLRDIGKVHAFGHAGSANGQFAEILIVPEKDFAVVTLANSGPDNGLAFNRDIVRAGLESVAGVTEHKVKVDRYKTTPRRRIRRRLRERDHARRHRKHWQRAHRRVRHQAGRPSERHHGTPARHAGRPYRPNSRRARPLMVTDGGLKGQRGYFGRDATGRVVTVDMAGRVFTRE